ncbi:MAG TPA: lytic transglycosylase domain-containing protein [Halomonas sp.]|nr:lytic transglycosylase domain-containing protein [Halomonas sp.]
MAALAMISGAAPAQQLPSQDGLGGFYASLAVRPTTPAIRTLGVPIPEPADESGMPAPADPTPGLAPVARGLDASGAHPFLSGAATLRTTLAGLSQASRSAADVWALRQWVNEMSPRLARYVDDASYRRLLLARIYQEAKIAGLAPELVMAVIQVESAFRAEAVSHAGATGLMQIMPFWVKELGLPADDLKDPWRNLRYGCTILAHYLAMENGDLTRALARYNGSLGRTRYAERIMRALGDRWTRDVVTETATAQR